jgi:hypothetical protein
LPKWSYERGPYLGIPGIVLNINPTQWLSLGSYLDLKLQADNSSLHPLADMAYPTFTVSSRLMLRQILETVGYLHGIGYSFRSRVLPLWIVVHGNTLRLHPGRVILLPLCKRLFASYKAGLSPKYFSSLPLFEENSVDLSRYVPAQNPTTKRLFTKDGEQIPFPPNAYHMFKIQKENITFEPIVPYSGSSVATRRCEIGVETNGFMMLADMIAVHELLPRYRLPSNIYISYDYDAGYYYTNDAKNVAPLAQTVIQLIRNAGYVLDTTTVQVLSFILELPTAGAYLCPVSPDLCMQDRGTQIFTALGQFDFWT